MIVDASIPDTCDDDMDTSCAMEICAMRTKPAQNSKYKKRVGAKQPKKLEISANSGFVLSPEDATMYRALAARCNYLSQDRPDISFSSKELCRGFNVPDKSSFIKLKRLARHLNGKPRLCYHFPWQSMPDTIDVYVDTDFAGCQSTRRSTSGGVALLGGCSIKHWSETQSTISLSSGESELHGIAYGASQALGLQSLLVDLGWHVKIMWAKRTWENRHLATTDLWIRDQVKGKRIELLKVLGTEKPADVLTKYVHRVSMEKALNFLNLVPTAGRPASAPVAMGA